MKKPAIRKSKEDRAARLIFYRTNKRHAREDEMEFGRALARLFFGEKKK